MKLVLAPRGPDNRYSQDSFVYEMALRHHFTLLMKGQNGYDSSARPLELIVTHNPDDIDDCMYLRRRRGVVPSVVHLHYQFEYYQQQDNVIESIESAVAAIVPTRAMAYEMAQSFPRIPWHVVNNGVRIHLFNPASLQERLDFKIRSGINVRKKLVGFVGRLTEAKGLKVLERVCNDIGSKEACLLIQFPYWHNNEDPLEADRALAIARELKQRNPENVFIWPDSSPRFSTRPARFFDALLMPSLSELQPMVVLESIACGVPVIATRSTPAYEEIGESGLPPEILRLVDLPARFRVGATKSFNLNEEEVETISSALLSNIEQLAERSDSERRWLADLFGRSNFVDSAMYANWNEIYRAYALRQAA